MFKTIAKFAITAAAVLALPGMAHAGTDTTTGAAALGVIDQCTVSGADVSLGVYRTTDTWGTVGTALGAWVNGVGYLPTSRGYAYLNLGSVTCFSGTRYSLSINGTASTFSNAVRIKQGADTILFFWASRSLVTTRLLTPTHSFPASVTN